MLFLIFSSFLSKFDDIKYPFFPDVQIVDQEIFRRQVDGVHNSNATDLLRSL